MPPASRACRWSLPGTAAAAGILRIVADSVVGDAIVAATPEEVAAAFTAVAAERSALAERLRKAGRTSEAEIIAIGALIAGDPALSSPARGGGAGRRGRGHRGPRGGRAPGRDDGQLDNPALAPGCRQLAVIGGSADGRGRSGGGAGASAAHSRGRGGPAQPAAARSGGLHPGAA